MIRNIIFDGLTKESSVTVTGTVRKRSEEDYNDHISTGTIEILVSESDMGRVIGKKGKIATSIKTLIQAKAYNEGSRKVKVNIDSF